MATNTTTTLANGAFTTTTNTTSTTSTTAQLPCPLPAAVPNSSIPICSNLAAGATQVPYGDKCNPACLPGTTSAIAELNCLTGILNPLTFSCIYVAPCTAPLSADVLYADADQACEEGGSTVLSGAVCTSKCKKFYEPDPVSLSCFNATLTPNTFSCRELYVIPPTLVVEPEEATPAASETTGIIIGAVCGSLALIAILVLVRYALLWRRGKWTREKKALSIKELFERPKIPNKAKVEFKIHGKVVEPAKIALSEDPSILTNEINKNQRGLGAGANDGAFNAGPKPKPAPKMKPATRRKGGRV